MAIDRKVLTGLNNWRFNLDDIFEGKANFSGAARTVLEEIKPILSELKNKKFNKFPYTNFQSVLSLLASMIFSYISPSKSFETGERLQGYMFDEINIDPKGDCAEYGQLSFSLVSKFIEDKKLFPKDSSANYFNDEEYWAVYILVRLEQFANTGDGKHMEMAQRALVLMNKRINSKAKSDAGKAPKKIKGLDEYLISVLKTSPKSTAKGLWDSFGSSENPTKLENGSEIYRDGEYLYQDHRKGCRKIKISAFRGYLTDSKKKLAILSE